MFIKAIFSMLRCNNNGDPLSKDKKLYVVGYAHLDSQWNWDYVTTIDEYIKKTLDDNFDRFEKFPDYVFNFTGSRRYEVIKEYYPERYEKMKEYIRQGRWCVSGSSVDECDVNIPSAESIIRQILYGNDYFRKEFNKESIDFILPDCFGFPASMPSIWIHCGLKGFSTQKLTWGSAVGIPFTTGVWEGTDGESIIAALDPGDYNGKVKNRLDIDRRWAKRVNDNGEKYGVFADYHYYGVGDIGGAPRKSDVKMVCKSMNNSNSLVTIVAGSSDQMYKDITPAQKKRLPIYKGDLLLTEHSAGTLTSQSYMKRWNRKNELLADSAERAAVTAMWLGSANYPMNKINKAWGLVLGSQMHDILPGTSIPKAYEYSWNDEIIALNAFASVLLNSDGAVIRAMDTTAIGESLVVYNPLAIEREDIVEAKVLFKKGAPKDVQVFDPSGSEVPSQIIAKGEKFIKIIFLTKVPSVGFAVYDVRPSENQCSIETELKIKEKNLENNYYLVKINDAGDVASIFDKKVKKELLAKPVQLVFQYEKPKDWPAWNMDWNDRKKPPFAHVDGPAKITITEKGPVRVTLRVERKAQNSIFVQDIRLSAGDSGKKVEFKDDIDWQSKECCLKASFPFSVSNSVATYNTGQGTIERGNNEPKKYEVPSQQWFDITDKSGNYGVSILEDCKFGSDKPDDNTLRLTLLYTPAVRKSYRYQYSQDWGRHEILYAVYGHKGDWREGLSEWQALRMNQPLVAFQSPAHKGELGREFSFLKISTPQVDVRALKKAENSDKIILRLQEIWGQDVTNVTISFPGKIVSGYEVDGQERKIKSRNNRAKLINGKLVVDLTKFSPLSFALSLDKSPVQLDKPIYKSVALKYNEDVISTDAKRDDGDMINGRTFPAEMLPAEIISEGIVFKMGSSADGKKNAVACMGQKISLPKGKYNRVYLLAAADEDTSGVFKIDKNEIKLNVQDWTGYIGQYDNRVWDDSKKYSKVIGMEAGYIKRDNVAWFCSHRHSPSGNDTYQYSYIFKYALELPEKATNLTLPNNSKVKIFAVTVSNNKNNVICPARPLYDDFTDRKKIELC